MKFTVGLTIAGLLCLNLASGAVHPSPVHDLLGKLAGQKELPTKVKSQDDMFPFLSSLIFQMSTAVLGVSKGLQVLSRYAEVDTFPITNQFTWQFTKEVCFEWGCTETHEQIQIGGQDMSSDEEATTNILGYNKNDVQITFGANNSFTYRFMLPDLRVESSDFMRLETEQDSGNQIEYSGLLAAIQNTTLGLKLNIGFGNGSYSVSNLDLTLDYGAVRLEFPHVAKRVNGTWTDLEPIKMDFAPFVEELLQERDESGRNTEERYETYLQAQLNEALSGKN